MHTAFSGDSETPLDVALEWYAEHAYDFVVVTDHNHVTVGRHDEMLVLPGVELTQNLRRCVPEPAPGHSCLLHVNALLVDARHEGHVGLRAFGIPSRFDVYWASVERARELGGIAQLNHPNFHRAADADLLATLAERGLGLFELANEAVDSENEGPPSTEAMWDDVLSRGHRLWGTATDDAHHYRDAESVRADGRIAHVGDRGWVVVRATRDATAIREALREGRFYASNGVELSVLEVSDHELRIETTEPHTFELIGRNGELLSEERGTSVRFDLNAGAGRVRALRSCETTKARRRVDPTDLPLAGRSGNKKQHQQETAIRCDSNADEGAGNRKSESVC